MPIHLRDINTLSQLEAIRQKKIKIYYLEPQTHPTRNKTSLVTSYRELLWLIAKSIFAVIIATTTLFDNSSVFIILLFPGTLFDS